MVVTRGVVHAEAIPEDWKSDGEGLADFVQRLPEALRYMLGPDARLPRMLFTDRGTGMYTSTGKVVAAYNRSEKECGFRLYWGDDASQQSPDMGDLLVHETAVAWLRQRMMREKPVVLPWEETQEQWIQRARRAVQHINDHVNARGVCVPIFPSG